MPVSNAMIWFLMGTSYAAGIMAMVWLALGAN
jgi:hypothetical protein